MDKQLALGFPEKGKKKKVGLAQQTDIMNWVRECKDRASRPTLKEAIQELSGKLGFTLNTRTLRVVMREAELDMDTFFQKSIPDPAKQSAISTLYIRVTSLVMRVEVLEARLEAMAAAFGEPG